MPSINKNEMVTNIHLFLLTPGLIPGVNEAKNLIFNCFYLSTEGRQFSI